MSEEYLEEANIIDILRGKAVYLYDDSKNISEESGNWYRLKKIERCRK